MSVLWLVRHAEAEKGPDQAEEDLFSVARDPPLSARGVEQARRARDVLSQENVGAVFASPARRAQETARILAAPHGSAVRTDARFVELPVPGRDYEEKLHAILDLPQRFREDPSLYADARHAFDAAVREVASRHDRAIIVAHGLSNRAFLCSLRGIALEEMLTLRMDHAEVVRIEL